MIEVEHSGISVESLEDSHWFTVQQDTKMRDGVLEDRYELDDGSNISQEGSVYTIHNSVIGCVDECGRMRCAPHTPARELEAIEAGFTEAGISIYVPYTNGFLPGDEAERLRWLAEEELAIETFRSDVSGRLDVLDRKAPPEHERALDTIGLASARRNVYLSLCGGDAERAQNLMSRMDALGRDQRIMQNI